MRSYEISAGQGLDGLRTASADPAPLGPNQVRVSMGSAALNYRDLLIIRGYYPTAREVLTPLSDGAGEVIEVGADVRRFRPGDRVVTSFWPHWISGRMTAANTAASLGAGLNGVLAEQFTGHEDSLARAPASLSLEEAATIPCAGVTAWNALFVAGGVAPGASVLILGTGGVSIWALQLAKAAGLRPIVLSSSDEKLVRARALGAADGINYREVPAWEDRVLDLTGGEGVDLVVEVGGEATIARSLAATRAGGTVVVIGGLTGFGGAGVNPGMLIGGAKRLAGVSVGSRTMMEDLNRFIEVAGIRPVIDRGFAFTDARAAFEHLGSGAHFGKVVIGSATAS